METNETSVILDSVPNGAEEAPMIDDTQWGAIRALFASGLSKKAIARHLGLDPKTVRKWIERPFEVQRRRASERPLDRFDAFLTARAPEVGFNGVVLLRELRDLGYTGSYQALARRLQPLRAAARPLTLPTPRFETEPGQQAQVDWGSTAAWIGELPIRIHLFVMVLGFSRRLFARAYLNERIDALFDGHAAAFTHFGGRTRQILYDNPRTIVLRKDEASGEVEWNKTFKDRMDFYGVDIRLCRYYRAQTKGKVESGVKYVKRNALAGKRFASFDELNVWLLDWCVRVADQRVHGTTHERPAERFARAEVGAMIAVDEREPTPRERVVTRVVPSDTYVMIETNRYPTPCEWVGRTASVRVLPTEIVISVDGHEPVTYARLDGRYGIARWGGDERQFARPSASAAGGPPQWDPVFAAQAGHVEVRALEDYAALVEEVSI